MKLAVLALVSLVGLQPALARIPASTTDDVQTPEYRAEVEAFRKQRGVEIGGLNGWASLVGLHWIEPGTHTIGRAATNKIVLTGPSAPPSLGTLTVTDRNATLTLAPGLAATIKGAAVSSAVVLPGGSAENGLVVGKTTIVTIRRGTRLALRVWDQDAPARSHHQTLSWLAIDPKWRIDAKWIPHTPAPKLRILNVLNEIVDMTNPGVAEFTVGGKTYQLEGLLESDGADELFFMFKDGTSGKTTYGAGRYLYTPLAKDGRVVLDFNKAKNPPCAFTDFATCPLPLAKNRLTLSILAGELFSGH